MILRRNKLNLIYQKDLKRNVRKPVINQNRIDRGGVLAPNIESCRNENTIHCMTDDRLVPVWGIRPQTVRAPWGQYNVVFDKSTHSSILKSINTLLELDVLGICKK